MPERTHHVLVDPAVNHGAMTVHYERETSRDRQWTRDRKLPSLSDPVILADHPTIRHTVRCCGGAADTLPLQTNRGEQKTFLHGDAMSRPSDQGRARTVCRSCVGDPGERGRLMAKTTVRNVEGGDCMSTSIMDGNESNN